MVNIGWLVVTIAGALFRVGWSITVTYCRFFAKKADEEEQEEALRYLKGLKRENDTPVERAPLRQRTDVVDLEKDLGRRKLITERTVKKHQGGYWCEVCECLLKDSQSYLDHLNGRDHNRNMGMNMRVEKVSVDRVKEKLEEMKKLAREKAQKDTKEDVIDREAVQERLEHIKREEEKDKQRKKEKKKLKKRKKREALYGPGYLGTKEENEPAEGGTAKESSHDELMRIMGISGFGGS
ncbi:zinc finger, matrin-type 2 [Perkinsus olseni]|uniref:Zinc finger, matrin-type 2 n=1 Tax=Perkinsus olseni TaxID=32597 RepID=A0A7J6RRB4_PEROL|nr:zinc finger, matrin-type 2 [Perkinsus olseni]